MSNAELMVISSIGKNELYNHLLTLNISLTVYLIEVPYGLPHSKPSKVHLLLS